MYDMGGAQLIGLVDSTRQPASLRDALGRLVHCNEAYLEMYGCERADLADLDKVTRFLSSLGASYMRRTYECGLADPDGAEIFTQEIIRQDGSVRWVQIRSTVVLDDDGAMAFRYSVFEDITPGIEARHQLDAMINSAPLGVALRTIDGTLVRCNQAYLDIYGLPRDELISIEQVAKSHAIEIEALRSGMSKTPHVDRNMFDLPLHRPDGTTSAAIGSYTVVPDSQGKAQYWLIYIDDVTEIRAQSRLAQRAHCDELTRLANRHKLMDELESAWRTDRFPGAVLFIDIDRFKEVNDSLNHAAGDRLLKIIGERIFATTPFGDTVARIGGDEFVVALSPTHHGPHDRVSAIRTAERILEATSQPADLGGQEVFPTVSIGIALADDADTEYADIIQRADVAMYEAKKRGGNCYNLARNCAPSNPHSSVRVDSELRRAIENGALAVYYQPEVRLLDEELAGAEALVRWNHPTRGLLSASEFMPLAEHTGAIIDIDRWVLRQACRQTASWLRTNSPELTPDFATWVNLSARQFTQQDLVEFIASALEETDLDPSRLGVEITESGLMADPDETRMVLEELRDLGVKIALDDFGTGYCSMTYINHFPIDVIKTDRSFVSNIPNDRKSTAVIAAVIDLANALDLTVVTEGIETAEQLRELRVLGAEQGQGYLFGPAMLPHVLPGAREEVPQHVRV